MKIITNVRLVNGVNPGEVWMEITRQVLKIDDAGLVLGLGPEEFENQLLYPYTVSQCLPSNAS